MGLRFRKSVKIGGIRLNFSNSGVGWSWGWPGFRVTHTARGTVRTTYSIPGTGISWVEEHKEKPLFGNSKQPQMTIREALEIRKKNRAEYRAERRPAHRANKQNFDAAFASLTGLTVNRGYDKVTKEFEDTEHP